MAEFVLSGDDALFRTLGIALLVFVLLFATVAIIMIDAKKPTEPADLATNPDTTNGAHS